MKIGTSSRSHCFGGVLFLGFCCDLGCVLEIIVLLRDHQLITAVDRGDKVIAKADAKEDDETDKGLFNLTFQNIDFSSCT